MLSFKEIKELIDLVSERGLSGLEVEQAGFRVRIEGMRPPSSNGSAPALSAGPAEPVVDKNIHVITSPIVGTFYRSSEPGSSAFVEIGSAVKKGDVLCIIEAMKLMNEIDSEYDGEVVNIYVESGQPVQYGERLFAIRTR